MHGSFDVVKKWAETADLNELEASSGRSALHKVGREDGEGGERGECWKKNGG